MNSSGDILMCVVPSRQKARGHYASHSHNFQAQVDGGSINAGTPKQAIERLQIWLQETRPSILMLWAGDGGMGQKDAEESKNALLCQALRCSRQSAILATILASLPGLLSPRETNQPASLAVRWQMAELAN